MPGLYGPTGGGPPAAVTIFFSAAIVGRISRAISKTRIRIISSGQSNSLDVYLLIIEDAQAELAGDLDMFHLAVEIVTRVVGLRERNRSHAHFGAFGFDH